MKSLRGEALASATLGWHGLEGDRRLAFRRLGEHGGFPWLTASKLPELIQFTPQRLDATNPEALPTHVVTPQGEALPVFGEALDAEVGRRLGAPVQLTHLRHGIFDDATVSVISAHTAAEICRLAGTPDDVRRFRPNVVVRCSRAAVFEEDAWLGGVLTFGDAAEAPSVSVTMRDIRCVMVNFDPDGGPPAHDVLKAVVRANQNNAGVYGTVTRVGALAVGQVVRLHR